MSSRESPRVSLALLTPSDRLLLAAVTLLPWAFGGIEIWAFRSAALLIVAAVTVKLAGAEYRSWHLGRARAILVPALLFLAIALIQIVPLPGAVIGALSPKAQEIYASTFDPLPGTTSADPLRRLEQRALDQVPEASDVLPLRDAAGISRPIDGRWDGWRTLSLAPAFSFELICWYAALLLAFLLAQSAAADTQRRRCFAAVLFLDFLALAVFGLVYAAIGNENLYWVRPTVQNATPFGPYVNPANFAAMMELATPWALATAFAARRDPERSVLPFPIVLVTGICCGLAGGLSGSRGGVVFIALGLLALVARVPLPRRGLWFAAAATIAVAAGWLVTATERLRIFFELDAGGLAGVERLSAWRAAIPMLGDFPLSGVGIGAFRDVFPVYAPAGGLHRMVHLHNDYLELVLQTGWPGAVLLVWLVGAFVVPAWRRSAGSLQAYGLMVGLGCLFLHACVDFNHQIPANALMFVTLAAIAVGRRQAE